METASASLSAQQLLNPKFLTKLSQHQFISLTKVCFTIVRICKSLNGRLRFRFYVVKHIIIL